MTGNFPNCTYVDFIQMMIGSLGGWGKWVHYKHLYFILQNVMYYGYYFHSFLNVWNWNEVQRLTNHVRLIILK
jgi:hypothetical protein